MKIGYARVSTREQNLELQIDALKQAGCEQVYEEKISGSIKNRPKLVQLIEQLRPGDVLMVWKLDRLGRSIKDLIQIINEIQDKGAGLKSLNDQYMDTTSAQGKLIFYLFAALAEFERDMIRERTLAGLATARARGRKGGRPKGLSQKAQHTAIIAERLYEEGQKTITEICKELSISRTALYSYLRHREVEIGAHRKKMRFLKAELWLNIQSNSSQVRGKKSSKKSIEFFVLKKFDFKKDKNKDGIYSLTISYQSEKELDLLVKQILKDIHDTVELNNCSAEASIRALDESEKYWKGAVP